MEIDLCRKAQPPFIKEYIGPKIICECKNKKTTSVDVGMVTKLAELIPDREQDLGFLFPLKVLVVMDGDMVKERERKYFVRQISPLFLLLLMN